jgi:hypothetical protein
MVEQTGRDLKGSDSVIIEAISRNLPRGAEKTMKIIRIAAVSAEIRIENLLNTSTQ